MRCGRPLLLGLLLATLVAGSAEAGPLARPKAEVAPAASRRCLLDRCKRFLRSAKERLTGHKDRVWLGSAVSLASAELGETALATSRVAGRAARSGRVGLRLFGFAGAAGLALTGAHELGLAASTSEKLDAASDLAWGAQGLSDGLLGKAALGLGVVGALCQTAAGCRRIYKGWKEHDRAKVKLGALDLAGGLTWLGWDLAGTSNPYFLGAYAGIMIAREGYANRDALKAFAKRGVEKIRCVGRACARGIASGAAFVKQGVSSLRDLARELRAPPRPALATP